MKLVLSFSLLLVATCGLSRAGITRGNVPKDFKYLEPRITGGQTAKPNEFPYQAGIYTTVPAKHFWQSDLHMWCGASLITKDFVLTAAHCLHGISEAVVILGAHNIQQAEEKGRVMLPVTPEDFIVHSSYDPELSQNDIALIKLPLEIDLSDEIQLVKLPKSDEVNDGHIATSTGWGKMGDDAEVSPVLQFVQLRILEKSECTSRFPYNFNPSKMLCVSGTDKKSVCPGDSGGPLVFEGKNGTKTLIGLTSFGGRKCQLGFPSVFTRVAAYLDWISKNTKIQV